MCVWGGYGCVTEIRLNLNSEKLTLCPSTTYCVCALFDGRQKTSSRLFKGIISFCSLDSIFLQKQQKNEIAESNAGKHLHTCIHTFTKHTDHSSFPPFWHILFFPSSITLSDTHSEVHWSETELTAVNQPRGLSSHSLWQPGPLKHNQRQKQVNEGTRAVRVHECMRN